MRLEIVKLGSSIGADCSSPVSMIASSSRSAASRPSFLSAASSTPCLLNDAETLLGSSEADFFQKQVAAAAHIAKVSEAAAAGCREGCDAKVALKCVVVGDHGVGKTALLSRYVSDEFMDDHKPTVLDNLTVQLSVNSRAMQLSITDTAGLLDFHMIRQLSYSQVNVILLCFSVVEPSSLHNVLEVWLPEIRKHCPNTPILLVGTQVDLRSDLTVFRRLMEREEQPVWPERGRKWVKVLKLAGYLECSAKTGKGMKTVFDEAIWIAMKRHKQTKGMPVEKSGRSQVERRHSGPTGDDDTSNVSCIGPVSSRQRNAMRLISNSTTSSGESSASTLSSTSSEGSAGSSGVASSPSVVRRLARMFGRSSPGLL